MERRKFLTTVGSASALGLAGCLSSNPDEQKQTAEQKTTTKSDSGHIYYPSHMDKMAMLGMAKGNKSSRLRVALTAAKPHSFWVVTGSRKNKVKITDKHTMHLMVNVWDKKTGVLAPSAAPSLTVYRDGEQVSSLSPWSMLSQSMGFHFGDNVSVSGKGDYRFEVSVADATEALPDSLSSVFQQDTVSIKKSGLEPAKKVKDLGAMQIKKKGKKGAIPPMNMDMMPIPQQPKYETAPVSFTDAKTTDGVTTAVGSADPGTLGVFTDASEVLVVSPQTRYNRYPLPLTGVSAKVTRNGKTIHEGDLSPALHPDLGYFYGAGVSGLKLGDKVDVTYSTPPQFARHVGYEKALFNLSGQTFTL